MEPPEDVTIPDPVQVVPARHTVGPAAQHHPPLAQGPPHDGQAGAAAGGAPAHGGQGGGGQGGQGGQGHGARGAGPLHARAHSSDESRGEPVAKRRRLGGDADELRVPSAGDTPGSSGRAGDAVAAALGGAAGHAGGVPPGTALPPSGAELHALRHELAVTAAALRQERERADALERRVHAAVQALGGAPRLAGAGAVPLGVGAPAADQQGNAHAAAPPCPRQPPAPAGNATFAHPGPPLRAAGGGASSSGDTNNGVEVSTPGGIVRKSDGTVAGAQAMIYGAAEAADARDAEAPGSASAAEAHATEAAAAFDRLVKSSSGQQLASMEVIGLTGLKEQALDALQEGISIADFSLPDQPLIYVNQGFERITGYSRAETVGFNCRFLQGKDTDPKVVASLRENITAGRACSFQLLNYKKNGQPFFNYLSLTPIKAPDGRVTHYVGIQSDVTELVRRREAEISALRTAAEAEAATEAKSKFLAHMSHEIRTPLNGLIAVGQMLEDTALTSMQRDLVSTIRNSGEALLALITDILDFSRIEADKLVLMPEDFVLARVMETAMEISGLRAAQKRLNVAYHVAPDVPKHVRVDPNRLQQVLLNTLNNAVKFTEEGEVMVRVWCESEAACAAAVAQQNSLRKCDESARRRPSGISTNTNASSLDGQARRNVLLHFSVSDTGMGLTEAGLKLLFQSFSQLDSSPTRKFDGTGLGLAISRRLCQAMGGQMWAESPGPGKGSTFHFTVLSTDCIDTKEDQDNRNPDLHVKLGNGAATEAEAAPPMDATVLVFDRCDSVRAVLAEQLRQFAPGISVDESVDIEATIAALRRKRYTLLVAESSTSLLRGLHTLQERAGDDTEGSGNNRGTGLVPNVVLMTWPPAARDDAEPWFAHGSFTHSADTGPASSDECVPQAKLLDGLPITSTLAKPVRNSKLRSAVAAACRAALDVDEEAKLSVSGSGVQASRVHWAGGSGCGALGGVQTPGQPGSGTGATPTGGTSRLGGKLKILLAEDNNINLRVARGILARCGHRDVTVAMDGIEVLEKLHALEQGPNEFDVILMDLHMPRMGGVECVREIFRLWPTCKTPIVAVTADAFEESRSKCLASGFAGWLTKPFRIEQLEAVLVPAAKEAE